MTTKVTQDNKI